jgi:hypothetical protein
MANRKVKSGIVSNPVNGNWIKQETKNEFHNAALKQVAIRNEYEKTHPQQVVRINSKTVILKNKTNE